MITVHALTNNPFQENTYVLHDESGECLIIDPGMYTGAEQNQLVQYIRQNQLKPVKVVLTHAHIDHILGLRFVEEQFGLKAGYHEGEEILLTNAPAVAARYGLNYAVASTAEEYITDDEEVVFGNSSLKSLYTPGHSPAHLCFYSAADGFVIGGDVLFYQSIGRTDLPGGNFETLIASIRNRLFTLPDETVVYPGHGPQTQIGFEKKSNPFLT
ncbi:MAG: MBL fold metallo-hydrolase [Mucilaginibacter polytrichastri]|nr:MBL fold metallo-hydrolase [Mucilaginibacter polytrichastri]